MNKTLDATILRYVGYSLLFLLGAYFLYAVRGTLPLFLIGGLLAYAFEPIIQRLESRGYSRRGAVGFLFLIFLLLMVGLFGLLATAFQQVRALSENIDQYQKQATSLMGTLQTRFDHLRLPAPVKESVQQFLDNPQRTLLPSFYAYIRNIPQMVFGSLGSIFLYFVILPLITFSLMMEMNALRGRLMQLVPAPYRRDVTEIGQKINDVLGRYVRGQLIVCSTFGLLVTLFFEFLAFKYSMDYALILGLAAVFLYIIPYVGMAAIALAAGLTAYFTAASPNNTLCAILAVGACVVFNLVVDYGVSPRVLGKGVGLHPLIIIFALLSGAQMGGIAGMILAVPLFASLRVILIYIFPQLTAPIPETPPEVGMTAAEKTPQNITRQVMKQVEDAKNEA